MKLKIITVVFFYISILNLSAQTVNIPDVNFRNALLTYSPAIDTNNDGLIQVSEAEAVTQLTLMYKSITNMTGIQAFKNLKNLNCAQNDITTLDVSSNLALEILTCYRNQLTSLNLSNNLALKGVDCGNNKLTTLNLQFNPLLTFLRAEVNNLTQIDLSNNPLLETVDLHLNQLTQLNLKPLSKLKSLTVAYNSLTTLDLSCNTILNSFRSEPMASLATVCLNATQYANRMANVSPNQWVINTTTSWANCSAVAPVTPNPAVPVPVDLCESGDMTFNAVSEQFIPNPTYRWLTAPSINGPWVEITGVTTQSITINDLQMSDDGSIYKVLISSADYCGTGHLEEAAGQLVMHPLVYPEVSAEASVQGPVCDNAAPITYTATPVSGSGTDPFYQWYYYTDPTFTPIPGATGLTYTPATIPPNGTELFVGMFTDELCAVESGVASNLLIVEKRPTPAPVMTSTSIATCTPNGHVLHTSNTAASGTTIQWFKNGTPIPNSNTSSLTIDSHGTYHMTENNGACEIASGTVTISGLAASPDPQVSISSSLVGPACDTLQKITYTATPVSGTVTAPTYQWYNAATNTAINGATDAVYTPAVKPANDDKVYVVIHKADACVANPDVQSNTLTAVILPKPAPTITSTNTALCTPAGHVLQTSNTAAGTQIQWYKNGSPIANSNTANFTIASEGTYHLIEDNGVCATTSGSVTIGLLPASVDPQVTVQSSLVGPACDTLQHITYTATPVSGTVAAPTYQWYNAATNTAITGATDAVYTPAAKPANEDKVYVVIHKADACVANPDVQSNTLTAVILPKPAPAITSTNTALCTPAGHVLQTSNTAASGTQIVWYKNGSPIANSNTANFTIASEGTYHLIEDNGVCATTSGSVTIGLIPPSVDPQVTVQSSLVGPACDTLQHISYTATPVSGTVAAPTYQWYNAATNTAISGATDAVYAPAAKPVNGDKVYVVIHKDEACVIHPNVQSNTLTTVILPTPAPVMVSRDTALCMPQEYILSSAHTFASGTQLQWYKDGTPLSDMNEIHYTIEEDEFPGGVYHISESNVACTIHSDGVAIELMRTPVLTQVEDIYVHKGETIQLSVPSEYASYYLWTTTAGLSDPTSATPALYATVTTTFTLQASNDQNRCPVTTEVNVHIIPEIIIPNVITVNGDGVNDTWEIANLSFYPNVTFEIVNRWGSVVWKSEGNSKQWDGSNYRSNEVLPAGTYFYIINLNSSKKPDPYTGYIQIIN